MNKRWIQGVLIIAVCGIWSTVIYRYIDGGHDDQTVYTLPQVSIRPSEKTNNDQHILLLNYDDPFLKGKRKVLEVKPATPTIASRPEKLSAPPMPDLVLWPELVYNGLIRNRKSGKSHGLIVINKLSRIVKVGDKLDGFMVAEMNQKQIVLKAPDGSSKTFVKQ